jgi:hypothetical protein
MDVVDREFSYVLPIRIAEHDTGTAPALTPYLRRLAALCEDVVVVDDSAPATREVNRRLWGDTARVAAPDPSRVCLNGKVGAVLTGIGLARHERVVIADDDVRYGPGSLARIVALLGEHDLVRPLNHFAPTPWHASWDTARTLLNRATIGVDFPGTLGVRRSALLAAGGYDGDVLFENLELIRTIRASGGSVVSPPDLYVRRLAPDVRHFLGQRVRQAYDDFALPVRMAVWLAILPGLLRATRSRGAAPGILAAAAVMALAERGRRIAAGRRYFGPAATLLAPLWILERSCCAWLAVAERIGRGGIRYSNGRIRIAAHSERVLRRRASDASASPGGRPDDRHGLAGRAGASRARGSRLTRTSG